MPTKKQTVSFVIALILLVGFVTLGLRHTTPKQDRATEQASWPSREVEVEKVQQENEYTVINASYPKATSEGITLYFKTFIDEQVEQFSNDTSWVGEQEDYVPSGKLTLDISYSQAWSQTVHTYIFTVASYSGGAHGMQIRKTFSFNKEGQLLTISNMFSNGFDGLQAFSKLVQTELLKREGLEKDWVSDGASPKEENYSSFVVLDNDLQILFDPYQVAPYVFGQVDVSIPIDTFRSIANKEVFPDTTN